MKIAIELLDELRLYAGCDSVGIVLTEEDVTFMFIFTELSVISKVQVPLYEIYNTKLRESEIETSLLEVVHAKVNEFKRTNGFLD